MKFSFFRDAKNRDLKTKRADLFVVMEGDGLRIRLDLSDFVTDYTKFRWIFLSPDGFTTVSDLIDHIRSEYSACESDDIITLFLQEPYCLPSWESIRVLKDSDIVKVKLSKSRRKRKRESAEAALSDPSPTETSKKPKVISAKPEVAANPAKSGTSMSDSSSEDEDWDLEPVVSTPSTSKKKSAVKKSSSSESSSSSSDEEKPPSAPVLPSSNPGLSSTSTVAKKIDEAPAAVTSNPGDKKKRKRKRKRKPRKRSTSLGKLQNGTGVAKDDNDASIASPISAKELEDEPVHSAKKRHILAKAFSHPQPKRSEYPDPELQENPTLVTSPVKVVTKTPAQKSNDSTYGHSSQILSCEDAMLGHSTPPISMPEDNGSPWPKLNGNGSLKRPPLKSFKLKATGNEIKDVGEKNPKNPTNLFPKSQPVEKVESLGVQLRKEEGDEKQQLFSKLMSLAQHESPFVARRSGGAVLKTDLSKLSEGTALDSIPNAGCKIAFRILEIQPDYSPGLSELKTARVVDKKPGNKIVLDMLENHGRRPRSGKFELQEEEENHDHGAETVVTYAWSDLSEPVLLG